MVDHGFDYEVFPLDDACFSFQVGSYFLEVKATTSGDVRLTPLQAETAATYPNRFVLCVVDLRGKPLLDSWTSNQIEPLAHVVTAIGQEVGIVYEDVDELTGPDMPIRLRNENQLRYGVAVSLWESGLSIDRWIQSLKAIQVQ